MCRTESISYPVEAVESNFGSPVCERCVRGRPEQGLPVWQFRSLAARRASDGFCQVWPQAIPEGREALLTGSGRHPSLTGGRGVMSPLTLRPAASVCFDLSP